MPSLVNRLVVHELTRELEAAQGMLFLSFGGLTVKEAEALRGKLALKGVKVRMLRNSLARRVLKERGLALGEDALSGNTALAWGKAEAAVLAAKVLADAETKKSGKVKVRAGMLDGQMLTGKEAAALADVPDRNTLHAQILGCLTGPSRGLVMSLNGLPSGLVRVFDARARALALEAGASGAPQEPAPPAPPDETPPPGPA